METRTVSEIRALELQSLLNSAMAGTLPHSPAHHKIEAKDGLLLVDPVNGSPYVFVAPNTIHAFPFKEGSGTDHLRKRVAAELWFQQLARGI